jgi:hypothetical protein
MGVYFFAVKTFIKENKRMARTISSSYIVLPLQFMLNFRVVLVHGDVEKNRRPPSVEFNALKIGHCF